MVDAINKRVQMPRDLTTVLDSYTGPEGQLVMDVQRKELRLQDGKKTGGFRIASLDAIRRLFVSSDSEFGSQEFPEETRGFLARTADKAYRTRSFVVTDGLTVLNEDGVAGDPTFGLPARLKDEQSYSTDANTCITSGFYYLSKVAANIPSQFVNNTDLAMLVIRSGETQDAVVQFAISTEYAVPKFYLRNQINASWSAWADYSLLFGTLEQLDAGVDQLPRVFSAASIFNHARIQAQYANAFLSTKLFAQEGAGDGGLDAIHGAFTLNTNDRVELVASTTTRTQVGGDSRTAKIEIEFNSVWVELASVIQTAPANSEPISKSVTARIIRTAAGYNLVDSNWATVTTNTGTVSGRFRLTHGATGKIGSRGTLYRPA